MKEFGIEKANTKLGDGGREMQLGKSISAYKEYSEEGGSYIKSYKAHMEMNLASKQEGDIKDQDSKIRDYIESFADPESQNSKIFEELKGLDYKNTEKKSANLEKMGLMARKIHQITERAKSLSYNQQQAFKLKTQRAILALGAIVSIATPVVAQMGDKIDFSNPNGGMLLGIGAAAGVAVSSLFAIDKHVKLKSTEANVENSKIELHHNVLNKDEFNEDNPIQESELEQNTDSTIENI